MVVLDLLEGFVDSGIEAIGLVTPDGDVDQGHYSGDEGHYSGDEGHYPYPAKVIIILLRVVII